MLKHLGPQAIHYLKTIYNNSVNKSIIPTMWKTGRIIPLLKPGKPADKGSSYPSLPPLPPFRNPCRYFSRDTLARQVLFQINSFTKIDRPVTFC